MQFSLRLALFAGSAATFLFVMRYIRKSRVRIEDTIFWIFFSIGLVVISIFPSLPIKMSRLLGIESPANFVFISIIFILLIKQFFTTIKLSRLEMKFRDLVEKVAIDNHEK